MNKSLFIIISLLLIPAVCMGANYNPDKSGSFRLNPRNKKEVRIIANRGYSSNYPENTMIALSKAAETNCDMLMVDVRSTKDNIPVAMKDQTLDRTTNTTGDIKSKTYQELTGYRAGFSDVFGLDFAEEGIPSLEQIFTQFRSRKFMLNIYSPFDISFTRTAMRAARYSEKNAVFTFNSLQDISTAKGAKLSSQCFYRSPLEEYYRAEDKGAWISNAKKAGAAGFIVSYVDVVQTLTAAQRGVFMIQCSKYNMPVYVIGASSGSELTWAMEYQLRGLIGKKGYTGKFAGVITTDPGRAMLIAGRLKAQR